MKEIRVTAHGADILPIDALIEFQGNLKTITRANLDKLKRSILKHGFTAPIFVWKGVDNHILDGHQRLKALIEMRQEGYNIPLLPVVYIDADSEAHAKEKLLYITSQYGDFTTDGFAEFVSELDFDFDDIRLTDGEFSIDFGQTEETTGDDEAPEVAEGEPDSKLGEIYELGPHRLMCGDSTDAEQVARLMGGEKAGMVFTDPPYGISIVDKKTKKVGAENLAKNTVYSEVIGDETTETAKLFYNACNEYGLSKYIIWGGNYFVDFLPFSPSWIIWDKRGDMNSNNFADGEMAWCSFHTRVRIYKQVWNGMIREGERDKRLHPTQKPVDMLQNIIVDNIEDNIIIDFFGGSGSTLIACAKTDRQCRMMELDPQYCDVIRRRWTKWARENGKDVGTGGLEPMEI